MKKLKLKTDGTDIQFNEVRGMVRKELIERYGGIAKFLHSEKGKEFGGLKIKNYLYDTGPINYEVISGLCKFLGLGELTRKIVVSRSFSYRLRTTDTQA